MYTTDLLPEIAEYGSRFVVKRLPVKSGLHLQAHTLSHVDTGFARGGELMVKGQGPSFPIPGELAFQQTEITPVLCASFLHRNYPFLVYAGVTTAAKPSHQLRNWSRVSEWRFQREVSAR